MSACEFTDCEIVTIKESLLREIFVRVDLLAATDPDNKSDFKTYLIDVQDAFEAYNKIP